MNAPFRVPASLSFQSKDDALDWAKRWRSDCLDQYGRCELEIGELLCCLARTRWIASKVKLKQPARQAFDQLRSHLLSKGHWKNERRRFDAGLEPVDALLGWRPNVAHGILDVWQGRTAQWLVILQRPEGQPASPVRYYAFTFEEAATKLDELRRETEAFCAGGLALRELVDGTPHLKTQTPDPAGTPF